MRTTKTATAIIILLLTLQLAGAWGIQPARQRAAYHYEQQSLSVTIENPERAEGYFTVSFDGQLAPYAHYASKVIHLDEDTRSADVPFSLKLPESLPPGKSTMSIRIEQIPGPEMGSTVSSLVTLIADVSVDVPVNGDHINAQLSIGESGPTQPTPITISIVNKGEEAVAVWADITIKGPTNKELASWQTEKTVISYLGTGKLETAWEEEKEPGEYVIHINLHYGDKAIGLRDEFTVGLKEVVSESISSSSFALGGIIPLDVTVRNKWNDLVEDVHADVYVLTKEGSIVQDFETLTADVKALSRAVLTGYWDTDKLVVGAYDINVIVNYEGKQTQQTYPVVVKMDELYVGGKATGEVTGAETGFIGQNALVIALILIVITTNVIIIAYFRRMKKKR
ncbi:hypothetical protein JXA12_01570 [Candidatus Woesearchaeota archaeon]|nr:hypothetical protein [Candidatus Woesearchaeota archaeon]